MGKFTNDKFWITGKSNRLDFCIILRKRNYNPSKKHISLNDNIKIILESACSSTTSQRDTITSVRFWKSTYDVVAAEAKPRTKQRREIISEYLKPGRELELMLEKSVLSVVENPEVYGLLIKGGVLEIYLMDLCKSRWHL